MSMEIPEPILKTAGKRRDELQEFILQTCKIPNVQESLYVELTEYWQYESVKILGKNFREDIETAARSAIFDYYATKAAEIRVKRMSKSELDERIANIANAEPSKETIIKQERTKLSVGGRLETLESLIDKIEITYSISPHLLRPQKLSRINSSNINKLICFDGTVVGVDVQKVAMYRVKCEAGVITLKQYNFKEHGNIHEEYYLDVQHLIVEEIDDDLLARKVFRKIPVRIYDKFCGKFEHGDRIRITGYYEPEEDDLTGDDKKVLIDSINIEKLDDDKELTLTDEELEIFMELAHQDPEEYLKQLTMSTVPHIYENHIPKLAILLSSIRGIDLGEGRSNIQIILVGNPGTGKSEMLKWCRKICQKAAYVDAPNASARGLLYGQEEFDKHKVLRAGVMIRNELVFLDEFDKIESKQRRELNTPIEQQIAPYHKTPFDVETDIDLTVIAACNPKGEKWIDDRSIMENLEPLEPALISRCIVIKVSRTSNTEQRMDHFFATLQKKDTVKPKFTPEQLAGLINHCRTREPKFTPESAKLIKDFILSFERIEQTENANLPVDTRKEIDLVRIISAFAKLLFKKNIDEQCVRFGINFYKDCLESVGMRTDTPTSQTEMEDFQGNKNDKFWKLIFEPLRDELDASVSESELKAAMEQSELWKSIDAIDAYLSMLRKSGRLFEPRAGRLKKV